MPAFNFSRRFLIILMLLPGLLLACGVFSSLSPPVSEATPEMPPLSTQTPQDSFSLPAPLYYLHEGQIWRLSADTSSQQQITQEDAPIDAFDLSPVDGSLVFVSNNSLILTDPDGSNRKVMHQGPALADEPDDVARLNDIDQITSAIRTPHWSPDGKQIVFIENGLQLFDLDTFQVEHLWHQSIESSEPYVFENVLSWSPDGKYLLVSQYEYPIEHTGNRWLSLLELGEMLYLQIANPNQESFAWSSDSSQLYLANAGFGWDDSLMRCEMEDQRCTLIAEFVPARSYYFYAHPYVIDEDELMVFSGGSNDPDEQPAEFILYKLTSQGYGYHKVRGDGFLPQEGLWSTNGDGVVITLAREAEAYPAGSVLWLSINDVPAIPLPIMDVSNLRWGQP